MTNRRRTLERSGVTMQEIAAACGVSHTTVSFVLRGRTEMAIASATCQRVLEQAIALDYHPQRNSRLDAEKLRVLYMCPDLRTVYADLSLPTNVLAELAEREAETGISFELVAYERPQLMDYLYRGICEGCADAVVLSRVGSDIVEKVVALSPIPVICMGSLDQPVCDSIHLDDLAVGELAATHLWEHGHRRVAILSVNMSVGEKRVQGFRRTWSMLGGDPDAVQAFTGAFVPDSGQMMINEYLMLPEPRPTAIFAVSDTIAYGAIHTLWRRGIAIPGDLSIMGCDDLPYSGWTCPSLTSIHLDTSAFADAIINCVRARCMNAQQAPPVRIPIPPHLVPRCSVQHLAT